MPSRALFTRHDKTSIWHFFICSGKKNSIMQFSNQPIGWLKFSVQNHASSVSTSVRLEQKAEAAFGKDSQKLDSSRLEMVWRVFSCHILGPLIAVNHCLNTTAYLSTVADTRIYLSLIATSSVIQAKVILTWFPEHHNEFSSSSAAVIVEHLLNVEEQEIRSMKMHP